MAITLREKKLAEDRVSLYLDICHHGKRWYEFLNIHINTNKPTSEDKTKRQLASEIRAKRELEIIVEDHGLLNKQKKQADFIDFFEAYITSKKYNCNLSATLYQLEQFNGKRFLPIIKITTQWLKDFEAFMLKSVDNNTALSYMKNINGALNDLVRKQIIARNPWHDVPKHERLKKKDVVRTAWTLEQLESLANTPCSIPRQFKQAYFFSCFTGLRWSDINGLMWRNILRKHVNGLEEWYIHFEQQKTESIECFPLSEQAIEILQERQRSQPESIYVFPEVKETDHKNKPVQSRVNYALKKWAKAAGLDYDRMRFHTGRHTYATNLLELTNGDLYTVSKLLGHKSIQTTQIYAQVREKTKQTAVKALPKIKLPDQEDERKLKVAA